MASCLDATPENNPYCYSNITWAMETGITTNPVWYADYPILSEYRTRAAFQYVLHEKRGPGVADITGKPDGPGYNCTKPCGIEPKPCLDIQENSPGICYTNVLWAMETGITDFPQYYSAWPQLTKNSSFTDFQWVLHEKVNDNRSSELPNNGPGWQCPMPCTSALFIPITTSTIAITSTANMTRDIEPSTTLTTTTTSTTTTTTTEASSSFPWWAWLLLICGLLLCLGAIAAFFFFNKKGGAAKKTKRSATRKAPAPPAAPAVAPTPVVTAPSVYTQLQPIQAVQPVQTVAAAPVYTRAPAMAVPQQYVPVAPPAPAMAVPAYQYAASPQMQQASTLFDQMDVNHDGVITRAEFARMMGGR